VKTLAAVQTHNLRDDLAPDAANVRSVGITSMAQPPFEAEKIGKLPGEMNDQGDREAGPGPAEQPADGHAENDSAEQTPRREPPCLCSGLHARSQISCSVTVGRRVRPQTVRAEKR